MPLPLLALAPAVTEVVKSVLNRVLPEKMTEKERAEVEQALMQIDWQAMQGQLAINAEEAKHESIFVAGWRPFIGWVCGGALAWTYCVSPMLTWTVVVAGVDVPALPAIDTSLLYPLVSAMLGFGGMRTYEKLTKANMNR